MTLMPKGFGSQKNGGDVGQANSGFQGNVTSQSFAGAANVGPAILGSVGGFAGLEQLGHPSVDQHSNQSNSAAAGDAGNDNIHGETYISI